MACKGSEFQRVVNVWTPWEFTHPTRLEIVETAIGICLDVTKGISSPYTKNHFRAWG